MNQWNKKIAKAQKTLNNAISDKDNTSDWMHPNDTIKKLSQILNQQMENLENTNIINQTKKLYETPKNHKNE